jgi:REP element-mobilizing transposase RayT
MMNRERKLTRGKRIDYTQPGPYFVTICVDVRGLWFGDVRAGGILELNDAGEMVASSWQSIQRQYTGTRIDAFVVMPDHLHGILTLPPVIPGIKSPSLSQIIGWFKTVTTKRYGSGVRESGWGSFDGKLWQPSFHDHILQDSGDVARHRAYIHRNPARWIEHRPDEIGDFRTWESSPFNLLPPESPQKQEIP